MIDLHQVVLPRIPLEEARSVRHVHPGLKPKLKSGRLVLRGPVLVDAKHDAVRIRDEFQVELEIPDGYPMVLPQVRLTDDRISRVMILRGVKDKRDVHVCADDSLCLCAPARGRELFPGGVDLSKFMSELVIPSLYGLSYYEKLGRWPWGEHSHGLAGLLESCAEVTRLEDPKAEAERVCQGYGRGDLLSASDGQMGSMSCVCGSGQRFERCHQGALRGLRRLRAALAVSP